jgi:hypothetical protein
MSFLSLHSSSPTSIQLQNHRQGNCGFVYFNITCLDSYQVDNTILHYPLALCRSSVLVYSEVCVQLELFTLLRFIANIHTTYFGLIGYLQVYKLVGLRRQMLLPLVPTYKRTRGSSSCLVRPTCTPDNGQLDRNEYVYICDKNKKSEHN